MPYLVRHLTSRVNRSLSTPQHRGNSTFWTASDVAAAVMDVEAMDQHLDEEDIRGRLTRGELTSTDLVRVDGLWVPLTELEPVATEALKAAARERRRRTLTYLGYLLLILTGVVLRFWTELR